jgi:thiamine-phosphate pyrophosphorylase
MLAISDRRSLPDEGIAAWLHALGTAGAEAVQLREKDLDDRELWELARSARAAVGPAVRLLVNGRLDIALAAGADGAHLPADGVPLGPLRHRFGAGVLLGRSAHRLDQVAAARDDGADYVTFGPVFPTPGKGAATGLAALERAAAAGIPVLALGGVTRARFAEVAGTGASGVAAIRLFQDLSRLPETVAALRESFPGPASPPRKP